MDDGRANFDDVAWDRRDPAWKESQKLCRRVSTLRKIESFVTQKFRKTATWVTAMRIGRYNNLYQMRIEESKDDVIIRPPWCSLPSFQVKKLFERPQWRDLLHKIPGFQFLECSSTVKILKSGLFLLSNRSKTVIHVDAIAMPNEKYPSAAHMLNHNASEDVLESFYGKAAVNLPQLFQPMFPCIGSLAQTEQNAFSVAGRPITQNMNIIHLANIPNATLAPEDRTYRTADKWYVALAEMYIAQLVFQHNDLVITADDCRNKYIARQIFCKLAKQSRLLSFGFREDDWSAQSKSQASTLFPAPSGSSSFRLWCGDLRASNILFNKANDIVALIDWEFAYIVPT